MPYKADEWYKSKRLYAAVVMVLALVASLFGYNLGEGTQEQLVDALVALAAGVGALLAIVSKVREKGKAED